LLPLSKILKGFAISDIIYEDAAVGSSVESVAERLEFLLSCGIPDLECHNLIVDQGLLLGEIGTNSWLCVSGHFSIQILLQECSLSDTGIANNDDLEETLFLSLSRGTLHLIYLIIYNNFHLYITNWGLSLIHI
jgi:hypothetical protein